MTVTQQTIRNYIAEKGIATKSEIVALVGDRYYCNEDKHTGDMLSSMVKAGILERVKPGVFRLGAGKKKAKPGSDVAPNQPELF